jgi:taurine dioxygenase
MSNLVYTVNAQGLGVTIVHANLAAGLAPHHTLQIRQLLHRHRLVKFENQRLTDEHLAAFAFRFGAPFVADANSPVLGSAGNGKADVVVVGNRADEYPTSYLGHQEVLPHSDHQWLRCPSAASLLYAVDVDGDGDGDAAPTTWTDMASAYTLLDAETRELIQDLRMITYNPFHRPFGSVSAQYVDRAVDIPPGVTFAHPLVRTHPDTTEKILYLNLAYEVELVGLPAAVGAPLIARLQDHVRALAAREVHHWKTGDLVLWDNQSTIHYRPAFAPSVRRVLKRVSIGGGIPY